MYYSYMSFVINKLQEINGISADHFIPVNEVVENIEDFKIRPSITYGANVDWSNLRREEDWILTLQLFIPHGNYLDLRMKAETLRETIVKHCSLLTLNSVNYVVNEVSLSTSFETDYTAVSLLIYVNSKY